MKNCFTLFTLSTVLLACSGSKNDVSIMEIEDASTLETQEAMVVETTSIHSSDYPAGSSVAKNGHLRVDGTQLVNEKGEAIQLRGLSSYGLQWKADLINPQLLDMLASWKVDIVRLAMYSEQSGYANGNESERAAFRAMLDEKIKMIAERGMYAMIDWHVLSWSDASGDPWHDIDAAREFFKLMSQKHANKAHMIYEIVNEPSPGDIAWTQAGPNNDIKEYAEDIIPIIRENDASKAVIIVGTPSWSGNPWAVTSSPLNFPNIMYAKHFYAGSHKDSEDIRTLSQQIPIFVSEWGISNYTGSGGDDYDNANTWIQMMKESKISWCNWSISDIGETTSFLDNKPVSNGNYQDHLSESGIYLKHIFTGDGSTYVPKIEFTPSLYIISDFGSNLVFDPAKKTFTTGESFNVTPTVALGEVFDHFTVDYKSGYEDLEVSSLQVNLDPSKLEKQFSLYGWFRAENNLVFGGTFPQNQDLYPWDISSSDFKDDYTLDNGVLNIKLGKATTIRQVIQPIQPSIPGTYILSFDASADGPRNITATLTQNTTAVNNTFSLDTTMKNYSKEFILTQTAKIKIKISLGDGPGTVLIDNIRLIAK